MARRPRTTFQALAAVLLLVSTNVNGQISPQGCKNLLSVFTAWGFSSKLSNSVNTYWTNCGCSFVVDIPKGTQAAATCSETADPQIPWSIASMYEAKAFNSQLTRRG
ncbi:hypothetical protein BDR26DRAFT_890994 [Obelidium mucronatum]|nr:hypothetical protein BDR26DRAFT_890994 [Obelidium mucronatum]